MAKLRDILKNTKSQSRRRFLNRRDMAEIKHYEAVTNARRNRGEIDNHPNQYISVCGCGFEGCTIHGSYATLTPEENAAWQDRKAQAKEQDKENKEREKKNKRLKRGKGLTEEEKVERKNMQIASEFRKRLFN